MSNINNIININNKGGKTGGGGKSMPSLPVKSGTQIIPIPPSMVPAAGGTPKK